MSEMKTPRTDALFLKHCQEGPHDDRLAAGIRQVKELLDFTRQLETELAARERELAEARASKESWRDTALAIDGKLTASRSAIREAVEFADIIEKWLDQNGHGPNAPVPKYHSNCFACGLMKKGAELRTQIRACLPEAFFTLPVPDFSAEVERVIDADGFHSALPGSEVAPSDEPVRECGTCDWEKNAAARIRGQCVDCHF
jgi:hypothetical protein